MNAPRVVMLTTPSDRAAIILKALREAQVTVHAIVLDRGSVPWRTRARRLRRTLRRHGYTHGLKRVARRGMRMLLDGRTTENRTFSYGAQADEVHEVSDPNTDAGIKLLRQLAPDIVVLGPTRILAPAVLSIPSMGVLNGHPGLLPDYRGVDVIRWALYNGDRLGVTVHYIDAGIDTGPIIAQETFDVQPGDDVQALRRRASVLLGTLMADVVRRLIETGNVETVEQPRDRGNTYTEMPLRLRSEVDAQLAAKARKTIAGE